MRRVQDERGSHVEPPLDHDWDDLTKLRWHLAVVLHDNDLPPNELHVRPAKYWINGEPQDGYYDLGASGWSVGALSFHAMWDVLNGVEYGIRVARRNAA